MEEADAEYPDTTIVRRVLAGEVEAFRLLVDRYQRQVFRLGLRFLGAREDAQDYVQEVFLKAFEGLRQYRRGGRFYSWLMSIAFNHGKDRNRKHSLPRANGEYDIPDPRSDPEADTFRHLAQAELRAAVAALPVPAATCVDLYFFFELTCEEVALITGLPPNTVKSHVLRAKQRLRTLLAGTVAEAYFEM